MILDNQYLMDMAVINIMINLAFPELRLDREFLASEFPTLAAYN